jgi:hypothetical protein
VANYIAELHDIGKLVDKDAPGLRSIKIRGHTFHDFDLLQLGISQPSSPSWYAQFTEGIGSLAYTKVPKNHLPDVFLTRIADELASAVSRTWGGSKKFQDRKKKGEFVIEGIHVLWNPAFYQGEKDKGEKWAAFSTQDEFKKMFEFINECKNPTEFFTRFEQNLTLTAEDKSVPFNIVSLLTHLELTGKIYRILKNHCKVVEKNNRIYLEYLKAQVQAISEAAGGRIDEPTQSGKWIYRLVLCDIKFPQSFSRLQDLNVFRKRSDLIKAFSEDERTKDYVLFFTDDSMCLFIPRQDELKILELLRFFLEAGFIIDYKEMEAELNLLTSTMERAHKRFHKDQTTRYLKVYEKRASLEPPLDIPPPLCDSCQMRHGEERIKDQIHEYLCDTCYSIREMGEPASDYAQWDGKAAWMKITLDQEQLLTSLHRLFEEYVDTHQAMQSVSNSDKELLKESFRPLAVQMDFVKDYKLLLNAFNKQIYEIKDNDGNPLFTTDNFLYPVEGYYEFGLFKVYSGAEVPAVLDLFYNLLKEYFPECLKDSPIKLSLSVAQVKYPYQAHWRFLSMPENIINIQSIGSAKIGIDIFQYNLLRGKIGGEYLKLSHFLHRLADIENETKSNWMITLEIFNNRKKFPALLELTQNGLSVHQILGFYKLTREVAIP